jgi:iron complex outermembrane receptor protein
VKPLCAPVAALSLLTASSCLQAQDSAREINSSPQPAQLGVIDVQGSAESDPYTATKAASGTKTDTPLMETPVSIQVVSRAVMDDQKATTIKDVLENVSGVRAQPSLGGTSGYLIRGFRTGNIYRNGLLTTPGSSLGDFDLANLESIEVVKGPAQLYGRTEPGGLINLNTKRGLDSPYYSIEQSVGSYSFYRTQWDAGGPITPGNEFQYRFSGSYQDNDSFRDFVSSDRLLLNPSVTWRPAPGTDITIDVEYQKKKALADFGIPVIGRRPADIPISRNLGDPNTPRGYQDTLMIGSEINHKLNADWAIHHRFLYTHGDSVNTFVNPAPAFNAAQAFNETTGIMQRNIFQQRSEQEVYSTNLDLTGKLDIAGTRHDLLVGVDYYRSHNLYGSDGQWVTPNPALAIDIFNPGPSYGIARSVFDAALKTSATALPRSDIYNQWHGVYVQDQVTIGKKLHLMLGGRYDWAETGRGRATTFSAATEALFNSTPSVIRKDQGFSPRLGVLYEFTPTLSGYGTWTTSFGANNAPAANGRTFDPQVGEQYELGLKAQLFESRLLGTLAAYKLTKDNILVADLNTADPNDRIANKQGSQGIELDLTGRVSRYLSLIASYAYTETKVIEDHAAGSPTKGNRLANVPKHSGSMSVRYDLNGQGAKGLSMGMGAFVAGKREVDLANTAQLPGYVRVDAFVAYSGWKLGGSRATAQLNVRNLLDTKYYESTDPDSNVAPRLGVYPGAPLTVIGSLRLEY